MRAIQQNRVSRSQPAPATKRTSSAVTSGPTKKPKLTSPRLAAAAAAAAAARKKLSPAGKKKLASATATVSDTGGKMKVDATKKVKPAPNPVVILKHKNAKLPSSTIVKKTISKNQPVQQKAILGKQAKKQQLGIKKKPEGGNDIPVSAEGKAPISPKAAQSTKKIQPKKVMSSKIKPVTKKGTATWSSAAGAPLTRKQISKTSPPATVKTSKKVNTVVKTEKIAAKTGTIKKKVAVSKKKVPPEDEAETKKGTEEELPVSPSTDGSSPKQSSSPSSGNSPQQQSNAESSAVSQTDSSSGSMWDTETATKVGSKKAKEGESAIKKVVKKKIIVKKKHQQQPKTESESDNTNVAEGNTSAGSSKETKEASPTMKSVAKGTTSSSNSNNNVNTNNKVNKPLSSKVKCITKNPKSVEVAKKSSSKKLTSKATKVISSKAKKVLPTLKKVQSTTKKIVPKKSVITESSDKETELTATTNTASNTAASSSQSSNSSPQSASGEPANSPKEDTKAEKVQAQKSGEDDPKTDNTSENKPSPQSSVRGNDDDSSTSDEIPLDLLLLRQQEWKRAKIANEQHEQGSLTEEDLTSDRSPLADGTKGSPAKVEEQTSFSPGNISMSDDENLRSVKNKLKDFEKKSQGGKKKHSTKGKEVLDTEKEFEILSGKKSKGKTQTEKVIKEEDESESDSDSDKDVKSEVKDAPGDDDSEEESKSHVKKQFKKPHPKKVKEEDDDDGDADDDDDDDDSRSVYRRMLSMKRGRSECGSGSDTEQRARRMKLFGFWSGPKRHRVASLNALAKVHCLYENESRGALLGICRVANATKPKPKLVRPVPKPQPKPAPVKEVEEILPTRTLRALPGSRSIGKHWDMHTSSSSTPTSSDDNDTNSDSGSAKPLVPPPSYKQKRQQQEKDKDEGSSSSNDGEQKKKPQAGSKGKVKKDVKRRRNRSELKMDLKDMVVKKRMASLNASAILAASYSVEKRPQKSIKEEKGSCGTTNSTGTATSSASEAPPPQKKKSTSSKKKVVTKKEPKPPKKVVAAEVSDIEIEELDLDACSAGSGGHRSVIELRTSSAASSGQPSNKKVAVIVNQDTDVTITGVYVNSTTRSTRHEGFCSISGMQYRISSTSHTQTEATAVSTEKVLHTAAAPPEHSNAASS